MHRLCYFTRSVEVVGSAATGCAEGDLYVLEAYGGALEWASSGGDDPVAYEFDLPAGLDRELDELVALLAPRARIHLGSWGHFAFERYRVLLAADSPHLHRAAWLKIIGLLHEQVAKLIDAEHVYPPGVEAVVAYLHQHADREHDLAALAAVANLEATHFSRLFRRETGVSPMRYAAHVRIERAKALLCNQRLTLRWVAGCVGFADEFTFSRRFRQIAGVSPQVWRRTRELTLR